jgi:hypothetical protein
MKDEDFKKAIELNKRLEGLNEAKIEIGDMCSHRLLYIAKDNLVSWLDRPIWKLNPICHILKRHDEQIRKEIDEEIQKIKKQIEEL